MNWETEIKYLMKSFCMGKQADSIIEAVKANANGNESNDILYERAWRRFRSILLG